MDRRVSRRRYHYNIMRGDVIKELKTTSFTVNPGKPPVSTVQSPNMYYLGKAVRIERLRNRMKEM